MAKIGTKQIITVLRLIFLKDPVAQLFQSEVFSILENSGFIAIDRNFDDDRDPMDVVELTEKGRSILTSSKDLLSS